MEGTQLSGQQEQAAAVQNIPAENFMKEDMIKIIKTVTGDLGNGVYAVFNSVKIKHCCVALSPPKCVQIIMLFLLQFLTIGNLTFRTVIHKNRFYSLTRGKNPSVQALSFLWKKKPCDDSD